MDAILNIGLCKYYMKASFLRHKFAIGEKDDIDAVDIQYSKWNNNGQREGLLCIDLC